MQNLYAMHSFVRPSAPQIHPHDSTKTPLKVGLLQIEWVIFRNFDANFGV